MGIDFGHAFGSATVLLPVPELIVFRLSPQMEHVFAPYGTDGWLKVGTLLSSNALCPPIVAGIRRAQHGDVCTGDSVQVLPRRQLDVMPIHFSCTC